MSRTQSTASKRKIGSLATKVGALGRQGPSRQAVGTRTSGVISIRYVIAGASGYLGTAVQDVLVAAGHTVVAMSRRGLARPGAEGVSLDLTQDDPTPLLTDRREPTAGVMNLVGSLNENPAAGLTYEHLHITVARRLASAAVAAGVPRLVQLSSLGVSAGAPGRYFRSKQAAEAAARDLMPSTVVMRASLVFGDHAAFFRALAHWVRLPVVPVPGDGRTTFDPVYRHDLASALVGSLTSEEQGVSGQTFEVGGPRRMRLDDLVDWVALTAGRPAPVPKLHVPAALLFPVASLGRNLPRFPLTPEQLYMLTTSTVTDDVRWHQWVPYPTPAGGRW